MTTKRKILSVLVAARKLITPREKWTQRVNARDKFGRYTYPLNADAVCFCAQGAIARIAGGMGNPAKISAMVVLGSVIKGDVTTFNDAPKRTHRQILAAFDRAIAKLKSTP